MERLILVTDEMQFIPPMMIPVLLACLEQRDDIELVATCVACKTSEAELIWTWGKKRLERRLQGLFSGQSSPWPWPDSRWLRKMSRKYKFPILTPAKGNFSDGNFIKRLRHEYRPTLIINCYGLVKLPVEFLALADMAVNYHNGKLPEYRGVRATNLSVYNGERTTGFTFHHMTEGLDEGSVLVEGEIPVDAEQTIFDLEHAKASAASECFPKVLEAMVRRDAGRPQQGTPRFFSRRDWRNLRTISEPHSLDSEEIFRRLKAFSLLKICIKGHWYDITKLTLSQGESRLHSFRTADGVWLRPSRYGFLPYFLYAPIRKSVWSHR